MGGIRAVAAAIAYLVASGCRFEQVEGVPVDPPVDAEPDAEPDAMAYVPKCMEDASYTPHPRTGRRYRLMPANANYDAATDQCAADDAHLAVVSDIDEKADIAGLVPAGVEAWLGYDDLTVENNFKWVTGETGHNGYLPPEPNNAANEDCTVLTADRSWHDRGCEDLKRPICECDPMFRPPATPACRTMMPATSFEQSGRRVFRGPAATWADAKAACEAIGAHLLVIGDLGENMEMDAQLNAAPHWIGFTDAVVEGTFRWVNGSPVPYRNWSSGPNDPTDPARNCAVLQDLGTWGNIPCTEMHLYACECDPAPP